MSQIKPTYADFLNYSGRGDSGLETFSTPGLELKDGFDFEDNGLAIGEDLAEYGMVSRKARWVKELKF